MVRTADPTAPLTIPRVIEEIGPDDALIVVDIQNDFCPGGALPVPEGDLVILVLNRWIEQAERVGATIVLTRDWHPANHCSFETQGGPWPVHCVQRTPGAEYHPDLRIPRLAIYVDKATDPERENFSDFAGTALGEQLRRKGIQRLFVGGLALDYCVRATVLDATTYQCFKVAVVEDAVCDSFDISHQAALFDLQRMYCDVLPASDVIDYIAEVKAAKPQTVGA